MQNKASLALLLVVQEKHVGYVKVRIALEGGDKNHAQLRETDLVARNVLRLVHCW